MIKNKLNWKLFFILLISSLVVSMFVLPYTLTLSPVLAQAFSPLLLIGTIIQSLIVFTIFILVGLLLSKKVGLGAPILEGLTNKENQKNNLKSILKISIGLGVLSGLSVILFSFLFPDLSITFLKAEMSVATWKGFLASFYGGIGEEIFARFFLMTIIVWLISRIRKGQTTNIGAWLAIIISAIIFGLGHLGITSDITTISSAVVLRAILLNGVPGVIFGWLYWKKGLESAMIAHFSADIIIHVITPLVATFFI